MIVILALVLLSLPVAYLLWYRARCKPRQQVKAFLFQGASLPEFVPNPFDMFSWVKKQVQKNPDLQALTDDATGKARLLFIDTDLVKAVLNNPQNYCRRDKSSKLSEMVSKHGLTFTDGSIWKLHRKIITGVFQYSFFSDMIPVIVDATEEALRTSQRQEKTIQVPYDIELISADIITRLFFGIKSRDVIINGHPATEEIDAILMTNRAFNLSSVRNWFGKYTLMMLPSYHKQKQRIRNFRRVFGEKIQKRIHELEAEISGNDETSTTDKKRDLVRLLLQHRMQNKNDLSETLSDDDILDEFAVFYIAGKDTTAMLVSMTLYCLSIYPEWAQKLHKEVDDTIKDFDNLSLDALNSMDQLTAVLSEVLRMYPPGPTLLERQAKHDHKVRNFEVKKGTVINTLFIANNYNPKYFNEPEKFYPERWFKSHQTDERWKIDPFAYLPFSGGQKNCIGRNLGLIEAKIILSMILKNYDFKLADPDTPIKLGIQSVGYGPVEPVPLKMTPRQIS